MINTPQISMYILTMEGEIVDVNVRLEQVMRLKQVVTQRFSRTSSGIASNFTEAWVVTSRLDHCLLA